MNKNNLIDKIKAIQPTLGGWTSESKALAIAEAIIDNKLMVGLEIGVYCGGSAIPAAIAMQNHGGKLYAVDPWSKEASVHGQNDANAKWWLSLDHGAIYMEFLTKAKEHKLQDTIEILKMTNVEAFDTLKYKDVTSLDYLNIDGNHGVEDSVFDVEHFVPMVRSGGFIWQDDIVWDGRSDAYERMLKMGVEVISRIDTGVLFKKI